MPVVNFLLPSLPGRYSLLFFITLLLAGPLRAQSGTNQIIRYVKPTASGNGDGTSWANASNDLQAMINGAGVQQVWVATGVYKPGSDRSASFQMKNGVSIYGGFSGTETSLAARVLSFPGSTTLSGDIGTSNYNADNSYRVISNPAWLNETAILDGFVIANANNTSSNWGGGIYNYAQSGRSCNPTIRNCQFINNRAQLGAAIFNDGSGNGFSSPQLINCYFQNNTATSDGGAIFNNAYSGGISNPTLINCGFLNNTSGGNGGAIYNNGDEGNASPQLINCSFRDNAATSGGGALYNYGKNSNGISTPSLINCVLFANNSPGLPVQTTGANGATAYPTIEYSLLDQSISGNGNLIAGTSPFGTGLALASGSAAIDAGTRTGYLSQSSQYIDMAGNPRFSGSTCQIDMGASEFRQTGAGINTSLLFTGVPASESMVCTGSNISVPVTVTGGGPATYQWYKDSFSTPVASQTTATLSLSGVTAADAGSYSVVVTGACNNLTSTAFTLSLYPTPVMALYAQNTCAGSPLTLNSIGSYSSYTFSSTSGVVGIGPTNTTTLTGLSAGNYSFTVIARDANGCTNAATAVATVNVAPARLYVNAGATGTNTGLDWDNAFTDLQSALGFTCSGSLTEIWVASGTYKPTTSNMNRWAGFTMKNGVSILGGFPNTGNPGMNDRNWQTNPTILSGDINNDNTLNGNSYHVISNPPGLDNSALLDGFIITGGNADYYAPDGFGGGVYNRGRAGQSCSPSFRNCLFQGNSAQKGGAIYNDGEYSGSSSPGFVNCTFRQNSASATGGAIYNGGANSGSSSPVLTNCVFQRNSASAGGAMYSDGENSGVSSPTLVNCTIQDNQVSDTGGAMYINGSSSGTATPLFINCILWENAGDKTFNKLPVNVLKYSLFQPSLVSNGLDISGTGNLTATGSPFTSETTVALNACSSAINAGDPATGINIVGAIDITGNQRIVGSGIDMGAVEFQGTPNLPIALTHNLSSGTAICTGTNIQAPVSVSGTGPLTYQWYKDSFSTPVTSQTTATLSLSGITATDAGSYSVVVAGACNSLTSTAFSLTVNALPVPTLSAGSSGTLTCAVPTLTLTAAPAGSFTYAFSSGAAQIGSSNLATVNAPGIYSVTVTNENGCSSFTTTEVFSGTTTPSVSLAGSNSLNCTLTSATLTATATGIGLLSYTFRGGGLSDGPSNASVVVINAPGTYTVLVSGANGCTQTATTTVASDTAVPTNVSLTSGTLTCGQPGLTLTASATNGDSFTFSGGGTPLNNHQLQVNQPGIYTAIVSNANGCTAITATEVFSNTTTPVVSLVHSNSLNCVVTSGTLTATATGVEPLTYRFTGGNLSGSTSAYSAVTTSVPGTYTVLVTAGNGCSNSATTTINSVTAVPTGLSLTAGSSGTLTCAVPTLTLTAAPAGSFTYAFSSGAAQIGSSNLATVNAPGIYSVTVTNENGCSAPATVTIVSTTDTPQLSLSATNGGVINCRFPILTLTAGSPASSVSYAFGGAGLIGQQATGTASISFAGTYSVTATDLISGCTSERTIRITGNSTPVSISSFSASGSLGCGISPVNLLVAAIGDGSLSYTYGGPGVSATTLAATSFPVSTSGNYSVTVTGANGCSATAGTSVTGSTTGVGPVTALVSGVLGTAHPIVTIAAGAAGATSYTLTGPGTNTTSSTGVFPVGQAGIYQVSAGNGPGSECVSTTLVQVRAGLPAQVFSYTPTLPLSSSSTTLSVSCQGYSFRFTGPGGYVFSNLYRTGGQYTAFANNITQPGPYVLTVYGEDGSQVQVVIMVTAPAGKLLVPAPDPGGGD